MYLDSEREIAFLILELNKVGGVVCQSTGTRSQVFAILESSIPTPILFDVSNLLAASSNNRTRPQSFVLNTSLGGDARLNTR